MKKQNENKVLRTQIARHFSTRPDKVEITSVIENEQKQQIIECKIRGYKQGIIRKDGVIRMCYRII